VIGKVSAKSIASFFAVDPNSSSTALQGAAVVFLLIATASFAVSQHWHSKLQFAQGSHPGTCSAADEDAAGPTSDPSTDVHALRDYRGTIRDMLKAERIDELDCLADRARASKTRFPGGLWKIKQIYGGLSEPVERPVHAAQEDWDLLLQRLEHWVTERPNSITARVALASANLGYADYARGTGYADTVSESGWKLFGKRTAEARRILDEASALPKCPEWYLLMMRVSENQDWGADEKRALFEEAFKFEPGYFYYARVRASRLLPKWSGETGDTERFTQEVADRIGGDQGDLLYFEVASADYVISCLPDDPHLSWERIERGFEASEKLYGVSMLNLNRMAFLATHFGKRDSIVADKIMTRIGEQWDDETWHTRADFDMAKKWAAYAAPFAVQIHTLEAAAAADLQTPQGPGYHASFEKTYRGLVQECARTNGDGVAWEGTFESLTSVGPEGTVEDTKFYSVGPVVYCVYMKLRDIQKDKTIMFPAPPKAPYWVKLEMDWADFAPVASR
jgi:hypothetical protein